MEDKNVPVKQKGLEDLRVLQGGLNDALRMLNGVIGEAAHSRKEVQYDYDTNWLHELRSINHLLSRLSRNQTGFLQLTEVDIKDIKGYQATINEVSDFLKKYGES